MTEEWEEKTIFSTKFNEDKPGETSFYSKYLLSLTERQKNGS